MASFNKENETFDGIETVPCQDSIWKEGKKCRNFEKQKTVKVDIVLEDRETEFLKKKSKELDITIDELVERLLVNHLRRCT